MKSGVFAPSEPGLASLPARCWGYQSFTRNFPNDWWVNRISQMDCYNPNVLARITPCFSSSNRGFEHLLKRFHGPKMVKACSRWGSLWFQKLRKIYAVNNSYGFSHNAMYEDIKRTVQDSLSMACWNISEKFTLILWERFPSHLDGRRNNL